MKKKILCLLLAGCMMFSSAIPALADNTDDTAVIDDTTVDDNDEDADELEDQDIDVSTDDTTTSEDTITSEDTTTPESGDSESEEEELLPYEINYEAHVRKIGWQSAVSSTEDGAYAGTVGQSLRMEALKIDANGLSGITYRAHVAKIGWQNFVSSDDEDAYAGTEGRSLAIEAIEIKLEGADAEKYDIYYRAHVQKLGWLGWAKNGESAGSAAYAYAMEALEIKVLPKGQTPDDYDESKAAFREQLIVTQKGYVQNQGWMTTTVMGATLGTTGKGLALQNINLATNGAYGLGLTYEVHARKKGWLSPVTDGQNAGVSGYAIEAIRISLTGDNADNYDIYYRAHVSKMGWLDWAKNGEAAGSSGLAYTMQAIQIKIVAKGAAAPGDTGFAYATSVSLAAEGYVEGLGWQDEVGAGAVIGTTGQSKALQGLRMTMTGMENTEITYSAHVSKIGWQDYVAAGETAGVLDTNKIEAIKIKLSGPGSDYYNVWYRVHSTNLGWLDWACNGQEAGTSGLSYDAQAVQVVILPKNSGAPGVTTKPFTDTLKEEYLWPCPGNYYITSYFGYRSQPTAGASTYHQGIDIDAETGDAIVATKSGVVTACTYNSTRGYYIEITHSDGVKSYYMHMSRFAVSNGAKVSRGQTIGYVGSTGVSTGSHLHFSLLVNGSYVNPLNYVSRG